MESPPARPRPSSLPSFLPSAALKCGVCATRRSRGHKVRPRGRQVEARRRPSRRLLTMRRGRPSGVGRVGLSSEERKGRASFGGKRVERRKRGDITFKKSVSEFAFPTMCKISAVILCNINLCSRVGTGKHAAPYILLSEPCALFLQLVFVYIILTERLETS